MPVITTLFLGSVSLFGAPMVVAAAALATEGLRAG